MLGIRHKIRQILPLSDKRLKQNPVFGFVVFVFKVSLLCL